MVTDKIKQLAATKAKLAKLERAVATHLHRELASLPGKYGFDSVREFAAAIVSAVGGSGKARRARRGRPAAKASGSKRRRRRAVITDKTRSQVKSRVQAGETGAAIAKALHISLPTVQNIKKALGLVKARG